MTRYLLDYPWPLDAALDASSEGFGILLKFEDLVRKRDVSFKAIVRFVSQQDYENAKQRLGRSTWAAAVLRFSHHLIRNSESAIRATPIPEPLPPLADNWKFALREELEQLDDWRIPQIIFPRARKSAWPITDEVEIRCEDGGRTFFRVLATLEEYESHRYAISDIDPWRHLEWLYRPKTGGHITHPCRLPKPPILHGVSAADLFKVLLEARAIGWEVGGKYYFIPPEHYRMEEISVERWRSGYAFEHKKVHGWKGPCPIDYQGRVWRWDRGERHWDVQLNGNYISVSHDGRLLT